MNIFGFDTSDPAGLQNALKAAEQRMENVELQLGGEVESILDRLDGATFTLNLKPIPKAEPVT